MMNVNNLPEPSLDAAAHSQRLVEHIRQSIESAGGWIGFRDYMDLALFAPGLGYYAAGAGKFGEAGDFVTAPELTPFFGATLAHFAWPVLQETGGEMLELGAGSGRLALAVLSALERLGSLPSRYLILDVSPDLRQRQRALFEDRAPHLLPRLVWLEALPEHFAGVVLANEVLDALPVHLVHWPAGASETLERGVVWRGSTDAGGFAWADRPIADPALAEVVRSLEIDRESDYLSEVSLAGPGLIRALGERLTQGAMLFIDYGFPRHEFYHPQRRQGTLMCHYRHRAFDDPFFLPGLTDITAHVDFTAMADAGLQAGLEVSGFAAQGHFLVNCGLLDQLAAMEVGTPDYLRASGAVQKLVSPSEMGELFKVIGFARGLDQGLRGFERGDRRHAL